MHQTRYIASGTQFMCIVINVKWYYLESNFKEIELTQKTSQTLISPCTLRPLRFIFPLPVRKS